MIELPNSEKLKQLPLRALVAYAVRCAMRVQLLFLKWQDGQSQTGGPPAGMAEAVAEAIALATKFASEEGNYDLKRGQELEETVIEAVMRAKGGHRGAAFAANAAYAALNAANLASQVSKGANRRAEADKVVVAVTTAADAAAAAHEPVIQSALDDWHALQLMRLGQFPETGRPIDPRPEGKLGPLSNKKPKTPSWKDASPTLRQIKKNENVLEQTREELLIQQEERKKEQATHQAQCDEYEKTIRHLKAEVIPLKRERDDLKKQVEELQGKLDAIKGELTKQDQKYRLRLTEFASQLLQWAEPESKPQGPEAEGGKRKAEQPTFPITPAEPAAPDAQESEELVESAAE